jgi:hypothetical protein
MPFLNIYAMQTRRTCKRTRTRTITRYIVKTKGNLECVIFPIKRMCMISGLEHIRTRVSEVPVCTRCSQQQKSVFCLLASKHFDAHTHIRIKAYIHTYTHMSDMYVSVAELYHTHRHHLTYMHTYVHIRERTHIHTYINTYISHSMYTYARTPTSSTSHSSL